MSCVTSALKRVSEGEQVPRRELDAAALCAAFQNTTARFEDTVLHAGAARGTGLRRACERLVSEGGPLGHRSALHAGGGAAASGPSVACLLDALTAPGFIPGLKAVLPDCTAL